MLRSINNNAYPFQENVCIVTCNYVQNFNSTHWVWSIARLKLKRSSPHFNGGFVVTFKVFRCKANFSSWYVQTIIYNFWSSIWLQKAAFHFVVQFMKESDFFVDIHPWVKSLRHSTILRFRLKICLLFFDRIGQCCQIRKMVPRYCILPAFFIKCQNWSISIRYTKNQIIVRTHQLEKPALYWKSSNMYRNQPLKCAGNVLTFKWAT